MEALAIYIDESGASHLITDPTAANPDVPPEALAELKKYKKLCIITYDDAQTKKLSQAELEKRINEDIKKDRETRDKIAAREDEIETIKKKEAAKLKPRYDALETDCTKKLLADDAARDNEVKAEHNSNDTPGEKAGKERAIREKHKGSRAAIVQECKDKKQLIDDALKLAVDTAVGKLPPLPEKPKDPPLACKPKEACGTNPCRKGLVTPDLGFIPTKEKKKKYIAKVDDENVHALHDDKIYFCTCEK